MSQQFPLEKSGLEKAIGYKFADEGLLTLALTHSSYSNEKFTGSGHKMCNERLEFLGDSILSLIVSRELYSTYPDKPEGELTRLRADVVCERALSKYAVRIGLGQYLWLGVGEERSQGRERRSILADAFEALLAAIYLDSGNDGINKVGDFLLPFVKTELEEILESGVGTDYKTMLQDFVQHSDGDLLEYAETGESGPDHMKIFEVEARLNSNVIGKGKGKTKKEAEQSAARDALALFGVI